MDFLLEILDPFQGVILFFLRVALILIPILILLRIFSDRFLQLIKINQEIARDQVKKAEERLEKEPEKSKPAWDLARLTLETYFNRNLSQVFAIFWLSIIVMTSGFGIIIWGITQAIKAPDSTLPAVITGFAGVTTEIIGATFLIIYRSTMQQASTYTKTLERINSVGMAMQILDTMPNSAKQDTLKNLTKAEVIKMLMRQSFELQEAAIESAETNNSS
jgi:nitrate reductase gamma subunit